MPDRSISTVLVLGAGFGGLEVAQRVTAALGDRVEVTLIDRADAFMFGFSKLDVMFGRRDLGAARIPYASMTTPGVRFRQETIVSIDPVARRADTDLGSYSADVMVVALGADYDIDATPGLAEAGDEFYSVEGAAALAQRLPAFERGSAIVGVCGAPFKCPPAPSETAFLLDTALRERGVRDAVDITIVIPFGIPIPPSPDSSAEILRRFEERGIRFVGQHRVASLDPAAREAVLDDGTSLPFDLFLGVPVHRAPAVVVDAGMTEDGWIPVDPRTLETRFPGVFAVGDVTSVGTPKAGVFAEGAATVAAERIIARARREDETATYAGTGSCYIEFGDDEVGRVDVDFFSTPGHPSGVFAPPTAETAAEKATWAAERRARWFGA